MTNILQMQEILKSIPDQRLMQEMQEPTGRAPQYLVMTEIQRRKKVRDEYQGQTQEQQTTVAEDIVGGPPPQQSSMAPPGMPPQMPQGMPPQMQPPMAAAQPPMNMEGGGALYMQEGSKASQYFGAVDLNRLVSLVEAEAGNQDLAGRRAVAAVILNRTLSDQFPDTIQAVAEQRTPGGSYQFSPLINTQGDIDKLPAGSSGTRAAVLDLLSDFNNKNPVGDALYFQNPEISGMIFPALRGNYDDGKRNNEPFPDGVTKIGDHVFSTRYGNEETVAFEPVAFRVEDNALTDVDKKRLGTDEALKITGAGEEVIMAESEPAPVPPSAFRGGIAGIPEKIAQRTGGFRGPSLAETLQQVSPDARLNVAGYDAAASAGSGLPIGEVPPPAPRPDVVERIKNLDAARVATQALPSSDFPQLNLSNLPRPDISGILSPVTDAARGAGDFLFGEMTPGAIEANRQNAQRVSQFLKGPLSPREAEIEAIAGSTETDPSPVIPISDVKEMLAAKGAGVPEAYKEVTQPDPRSYAEVLRKLTNLPLESPFEVARQAKDVPITQGGRAAVAATDLEGEGEFSMMDPADVAAAPAVASASVTPTPVAPVAPVGMFDNLDPDAFSDPSAGKEFVAGVPSVRDAAAASGTGTPTAAPAGGLTDLIAQLQAGRDDAKAMGLLTAGLGIMQQASQPGATLLSSIPGAAAGVKQYSADKSTLAKQQLALATLANQQEATRIAAEKATKPDAYERYERDVLADYKNSPDWEKYFFDDGTGNPGRVKPTVRSEIRKTYGTSSGIQDQLALQREASAKNAWFKSQPMLATTLRSQIREKWEKANKGKKIPVQTLRDLVQAEIERRYNKWRSGVVGGSTSASSSGKGDISRFNTL
jgi:spore germination cell wall hydrolase CwlJ-like protein